MPTNFNVMPSLYQPSTKELAQKHICIICSDEIPQKNLAKIVSNSPYTQTFYNIKNNVELILEGGEIAFLHRKCALNNTSKKNIPPNVSRGTYYFKFSEFKVQNLTRYPAKNCEICKKKQDINTAVEFTNLEDSKKILYDDKFNEISYIYSHNTITVHKKCAIATDVENYLIQEKAREQADKFLETII